MDARRARRGSGRARRGRARAVPVLDLEEAQVTGSGGCNRLVASFALDEDELRFGALATTRMACSKSVMQRERDFLAALARVTAYELEAPLLALLAGDERLARLTS